MPGFLNSTRSRIYTTLATIPPRDIALILATGVQTNSSGEINQHFFTRIQAGADLWHEGKARRIVGERFVARECGDETGAMVTELKRLGVPKRVIIRDDDSWRTLDSMSRVRKIFGGTNIIVVSEQFHLARAIFLGQSVGVNAVGFAAEDVSFWSHWKSEFREVFARVKAVLDVYVLHRHFTSGHSQS